MMGGLRVLTLMAAALAATPAAASCPAANQFNFSFATATAATLSYAGTTTYTATNSLGQSQTFTVSFATNGMSSTLVNSTQMPNISTMINDGGTTNNNLVIGGVFSSRTASITSGVRTITTTLTFAAAVRDLTIQVNDIDFTTNQYRDWLYVSGANGVSTYVPGIVTPWSMDNGAGAKTNASSSLALGAATTPFSQSASEAIGTGASANNSNTGTLTASLVQPVTSASLAYGNYPLQSGETTTGQQAYGIQTVSFCPMPNLTVTKTSAPWSDPINGTTRPKMIPGGDVIYTLTVANANTSPIDLTTTTLTDALPAGVTFYNGDIDDAGPLTTNFAFTPGSSGLTLGTANITYFNAANGSITPAAGYDALVKSLKYSPIGTMAANSSFSIQFRARIN